MGKKQVADQQVKYVPEYLVHFGSFESIAAEFGLELVKKVNFHEYYDARMNDQHPQAA